MLRVILLRLLWSLPLLLVATACVFVLVSFVPGDPARTLLGPNATESQYLALRAQMGLDEPLRAQYWDWLSRALHGDLGTSLSSGESVTTMLNGRLAVTLTLIVGALLVAATAGVALGVAAAVRGGAPGRVFEVLALVGLALPSFWVGLMLVAAFAIAIPILPATGWVSFSESPSDWARSLVLPVATVALGMTSLVAVQVREAMLDTMARPFVQVLEANGFSRRSVVLRHALRNAAIPVVTLFGVVFTGLLTATVLVEGVFALPGIGSLAVRATLDHDIPVVQGVVVYFTVVVVVVNLLVDLAYGLLDPRVRSA